MKKIHSFEELKEHISSFKITIRTDNYLNQLSDLYPIFKIMNLKEVEIILNDNNLIYDNTFYREFYLNIFKDLIFDYHDFNSNHILIAKNISKLLNCIQAYHYLNNYYMNNL